MAKKCLGCGSSLQIQDTTKSGYVSEEKFDSAIYCERCFRLKHYHEMRLDSLNYTNEALLKQANTYNVPVYYFIDLVNLNEESLSYFRKVRGKKVLVFTKIDLIPRTISLHRLATRIKNIYHITEEILFLSQNSEKLIHTLYHHICNQKEKHFLLLGMTNVGKSSFLNKLYEMLNESKCPVLISEMPNTTLDFMTWKFPEFELIDAPGFYYLHSFDSEKIMKGVAKKYYKPINMQVKKETYLAFDGLCLLKQENDKNSVTFYGSNNYTFEKKYRQDPSFSYTVELDIEDYTDLVLKGIGFFAIRNSSKVTIHSKEKIDLEVRPSLFGGIYDND